MSRALATIDADACVRAAAEMMRTLEVGALPVVAHGQLVGMLTDRDITVRAVAPGRDPTETAVREIMTPEALTCFDEDDLASAAAKMAREGVLRLVVLDGELRPVGMLSVVDLAMRGDEPLRAVEILARVPRVGLEAESPAP